jgi:hypothetical protein
MNSMNKEEMIEKAAEVMGKLYYEDVEFILKLVERLAEKKPCQ